MDTLIKHITERIVESVHPQRLILFGSSVSGTMTDHSDIDLCLIEDHVVDKSAESVTIRKALFDVPLAMDILIFDREQFDKRKDIWGTVQYEIDKKGTILYERPAW